MIYLPKGFSARKFWAKVEIGAEDECWNWQGQVSDKGYGRVHTGVIRGKRQRLQAHVVAYLLQMGPLNADKPHVLHRCDNRVCCNGKHLFAGTKAENNRDRDIKGRTAKGEQNGRAKLTRQIIDEMKEDVALWGMSYREIGRVRGLSHDTVSNAVKGKTYQLADGALVSLDGSPALSIEFIGLPSVNTHYNKHFRPRSIATAEWRYEAREKAREVTQYLDKDEVLVKRALIIVNVFPPYEEISDIHNVHIKPLLDGFTEARVYKDDEWAFVPLVLFAWAGIGEQKPRQQKLRRTRLDVYELDAYLVAGQIQTLPRGRRWLHEKR